MSTPTQAVKKERLPISLKRVAEMIEEGYTKTEIVKEFNMSDMDKKAVFDEHPVISKMKFKRGGRAVSMIQDDLEVPAVQEEAVTEVVAQVVEAAPVEVEQQIPTTQTVETSFQDVTEEQEQVQATNVAPNLEAFNPFAVQQTEIPAAAEPIPVFTPTPPVFGQ